MILLEQIIYYRKKLLKSLTKDQIKTLQPLIDRAEKNPKKLIYDAWHTYMLENWGCSVIEDGERVPKGLIPKVDDMAKYMSDLIKGLI